MEKELYMPPCCITKKLPPLLRENEGRMVPFYSQGDWGIGKLWESVSSLVSINIPNRDGQLEHVAGVVHTLLIVPNLDWGYLKTISEYINRNWVEKVVVIAYTTTLETDRIAEFKSTFNDKCEIRIGIKAASLSPMWLRYEDKSYNALLVSGPIFSSDKLNPTFAAYSATFFDRKKDGSVNESGKALVDMTTGVWHEMTKLPI